MKEIRLNDKMWFGKYKGVRMKDIADRDRMFLEKLLENPDLSFAENLKSYLDGKRKSRYEETPFGYVPPVARAYYRDENEPQIETLPETDRDTIEDDGQTIQMESRPITARAIPRADRVSPTRQQILEAEQTQSQRIRTSADLGEDNSPNIIFGSGRASRDASDYIEWARSFSTISDSEQTRTNV